MPEAMPTLISCRCSRWRMKPPSIQALTAHNRGPSAFFNSKFTPGPPLRAARYRLQPSVLHVPSERSDRALHSGQRSTIAPEAAHCSDTTRAWFCLNLMLLYRSAWVDASCLVSCGYFHPSVLQLMGDKMPNWPDRKTELRFFFRFGNPLKSLVPGPSELNPISNIR